MDKPQWKKIDKSSNKPCPRWGHTCCVIGEEIVFFGGYADSNYMNDLWTYNASTMKWEQVQTTGDRPSHRSNCSMNYDPISNQIVVFGGGGPNKQRFNSISVLDWATKKWIEITPKENEPSPWERTYHAAELKYPYLAVFGGEGVADLDDLWIFNFETLRWTEVKFDKDSVRPCARRFHSSCLIQNEMFIVAGCHSKYRCLNDVYSIDLTPLLQSGSTKDLKWVERKFKGTAFLARWGHSSVVYDNKIYVFAGRFSNDLNDLLVIDVQNNSMRAVKVVGNQQDLPKPRRRHCAGFVGSCMVAFGGFNGEYFNDLHYINVFELSNKIETYSLEEKYKNYVNCEDLSDCTILSKEEEPVSIHLALLARYFASQQDFWSYIYEIDHKYSKTALLTLLQMLYKGFGKFQADDIHRKYGISLPESINRRHFVNPMIAETDANERNMLKLAHQSSERTTDVVIPLKKAQFNTFLEKRRNQWFANAILLVGNSKISVNTVMLAINSPYFHNLFSGAYKEGLFQETQTEKREVRLQLSKDYNIVLDILLNYLMMGVVVIPIDFTTQSWMELAELADYFCMESLKLICESQLCTKVEKENAAELSLFSEMMNLSNLSLHCANLELRVSLKTNQLKKRIASQKEGPTPCKNFFMNLYNTLKFDLFHSSGQVQGKEPFLKKLKSENQTMLQQKENNRECNNV